MNSYMLLLKLKTQLISHSKDKNLIVFDERINPYDLLKIRTTLRKFKNKTLPSIDFIEKCADFDSIYNYFFEDSRSFDYDPYSLLINLFDPWLNFLIEQNYEVIIRRVNVSESFNDFHSGIFADFDRMELALDEGNYSEVNSLSSKILSTIFKEICNKHNIIIDNTENHVQLYNKVKIVLNLNPKEYKQENEAVFRNFTSNLEVIIHKLNALRNLYSDSHGIDDKTFISLKSLKKHHYKLIVDTTKSISNFILDSHLIQYSKNKVDF